MINNKDDKTEYLSLNCQNSTLELPFSDRYNVGHLKLKRTYVRKYNLISLVLIFFALSFLGWFWEVLLSFIVEGTIVNRGMLFGPWLPIYGFGGILSLYIPKRILKNPVNTFIVIAVSSSVIEYATSWFFEYTKGTRWWDYSQYALNINGRVCLIGTVLFGLGGCLCVYYLAPLLDDLIKKIPHKIVLFICIFLILLFCVDLIYSKFNPNIGSGISDYSKSVVVSVSENSFPDYILEI